MFSVADLLDWERRRPHGRISIDQRYGIEELPTEEGERYALTDFKTGERRVVKLPRDMPCFLAADFCS